MDERAVARRRLFSLRLTSPPLASAPEVVGWLGAVQAQEYGLARWSLAQRSTGVSEGAVDGLVADSRIIRTHILRPTWHFVLPDDLRWMMGLTGPRVMAGIRPRMAQLGLDQGTLQLALDAITRMLAGRRLTRSDIRTGLLHEHRIDVDAGRLAYLLMHAELELIACSGGLEGRQQTYALVDDVVPQSAARDRDEALAELTLRYFRSHGPSSIPDFTWWSGLTVADARRGLDAVGRRLQRLEVAGHTYWLDPAAAPDGKPSSTVHLLQTFDEYIVGYQRTRGVIDVEQLSGPGTWNPNSYTNPLIIDGQIAGGWKRPPKSNDVHVAPFRTLTRPERVAVEAAIERYAQFTGRPLQSVVARS